MDNDADKRTVKISYLGLMIALAFIFSYVEYLIPLNIGIPGAKAGLPNIVIVTALYTAGPAIAFALSIVRVLLVGLTFGNVSMMVYSMAGAILSFAVMVIAKKSGKLSITGVSVIGGVFHNIGQIIVAMFVLETNSLIYYLPFLIIAGTAAGVIIGILAALVTKRIGSNIIHRN